MELTGKKIYLSLFIVLVFFIFGCNKQNNISNSNNYESHENISNELSEDISKLDTNESDTNTPNNSVIEENDSIEYGEFN